MIDFELSFDRFDPFPRRLLVQSIGTTTTPRHNERRNDETTKPRTRKQQNDAALSWYNNISLYDTFAGLVQNISLYYVFHGSAENLSAVAGTRLCRAKDNLATT